MAISSIIPLEWNVPPDLPNNSMLRQNLSSPTFWYIFLIQVYRGLIFCYEFLLHNFMNCMTSAFACFKSFVSSNAILLHLTLKRVGEGGNIAHRTLFYLITPLFGIGSGPLISLNSSMSMVVVLVPCRAPSDERLNSDPPGKPMERQIVTGCWRISAFLTHLEWK